MNEEIRDALTDRALPLVTLLCTRIAYDGTWHQDGDTWRGDDSYVEWNSLREALLSGLPVWALSRGAWYPVGG